MHLIKFSLISSLLFSISLAEDNLLSSLKQKELELDRVQNEISSEKLSQDWLEQIKVSYNRTYNTQSDPTQENGTFGIVVNQPIFKSGGIYYAIKYSNITKEIGDVAITKKEQELIKAVIKSLYGIKKIDFLIAKQELLIKNAEIDIERKREQFINGFLDSSFLDSAMLNKNTLANGLIELRNQKNDLIKNFKDLSDAEYQNLELPNFRLIKKDNFLNENILLKEATKLTKQKKIEKNLIESTFLPSISLQAGYYYQDSKNSPMSKLYGGESDSYYTYGFSISMPLFDINRKNKIEIANLNYLKSELSIENLKREQDNLFETSIKKLNLIDSKIAIANSDLELYNSLLKDTMERFEVGDKTIYDVDTLKNSRDTKEFDIKINSIDKELELLELYSRIENGI